MTNRFLTDRQARDFHIIVMHDLGTCNKLYQSVSLFIDKIPVVNSFIPAD